ncbi:MAG: D-glycero-alpha-D-manno-heptose-1,7-bisphosphate 7-phosphatase [Methanobacteriota archaeon]
MRPAVFLDRDGTLIEDRGDLRRPDEVVFYPDTAASLRRLGERFALFVVTNQGGIARGTIRPEEAAHVNAHVVAELAAEGVRIEAVYVCPHVRADACSCIKPNPHFASLAARTHEIDLARSFAVGDHPHDVHFARAFGGRGIYVLTGHGAKHRTDLDGHAAAVVPGIGEASQWILRNP